MQKQVRKEDLPVVFEDVQIFQAVQADADVPVTLSVLLDRSNRFQVTAAIADLVVKHLHGSIRAEPGLLVFHACVGQLCLP
jgi:hypothetical protein